MNSGLTVTRIGEGRYRVEHDGQSELVYVAGTADDRWIFWNGQVFRTEREPPSRGSQAATSAQSLTAPMPARVSRVLVRRGAAAKKGEILVVLEAMKMELPIRALADATVATVHCGEGDLVEAGQVLIDLS